MSLPASASAVGHQTPWKGHLTPRTARSRVDRSTLQQQRAGRTTLACGRAPRARRKPSEGWASRVGRVARLRARARDGCEEQGRERRGALTCVAERSTERRSRRSREPQPHSRRTECSTGGHTRNVRAIRHSRLLERDTGNLETEHPNARRSRPAQAGTVLCLGPPTQVGTARATGVGPADGAAPAGGNTGRARRTCWAHRTRRKGSRFACNASLRWGRAVELDSPTLLGNGPRLLRWPTSAGQSGRGEGGNESRRACSARGPRVAQVRSTSSRSSGLAAAFATQLVLSS